MSAPSAVPPSGTGAHTAIDIHQDAGAQAPPPPKKATFCDYLPEGLFGGGITVGGVGTVVTAVLKSYWAALFGTLTVVAAAGCCYARKYRALKSVNQVTQELQVVDRDLQGTADRATAATSALRPQVEAVGLAVERTQKEEEELAGLRGQLEEAQHKMQMSEQTLNQRIQELTAANEQLQKEKQECQLLLESFRPKLAAFSEQNSKFKAQLQTMGIDVHDMDDHEAQLSGVLTQAGASIRESAESLSKGVDGLQTSTQRLFDKLHQYTQALQEESNRLRQNAQDFDGVSKGLQAREQEIAALQLQAEKDRAALEDTQKQLAEVQHDLEIERGEFDEQLRKYEALQNSLDKSQKGWSDVQAGIGSSVDRLAGLSDRFQHALADADTVEAHLSAHIHDESAAHGTSAATHPGTHGAHVAPPVPHPVGTHGSHGTTHTDPHAAHKASHGTPTHPTHDDDGDHV